jgi:hypothetical protein
LNSVFIHEFSEHEPHDFHWHSCTAVLQHLKRERDGLRVKFKCKLSSLAFKSAKDDMWMTSPLLNSEILSRFTWDLERTYLVWADHHEAPFPCLPPWLVALFSPFRDPFFACRTRRDYSSSNDLSSWRVRVCLIKLLCSVFQRPPIKSIIRVASFNGAYIPCPPVNCLMPSIRTLLKHDKDKIFMSIHHLANTYFTSP